MNVLVIFKGLKQKKKDIPLPPTNYVKRLFSYSGATLRNILPCNVRLAKSFNELNKNLVLYHEKEVFYI